MKGYFRRFLFEFASMILMIMAVFIIDSHFSYAHERLPSDFIRVGLTKEFSGKSTLNLKNKEILMGFSKKNRFYPLEWLKAEEGLTFTKKTGMFRFLLSEYSSLAEARKEVRELTGTGELVPVFSGLKGNKGRWKLCLLEPYGRFLRVSEEVRREDGFLFVSSSEGDFFIDAMEGKGYPQFEVGKSEKRRLVKLENKRYRGRIEIGSYGKQGLTAVNVIRIEDYVKGVVPIEVGYTWHIEAMKAQAVAARSFGLSMAGFGADSDYKRGYKLNNHSHQSYGGFDAEGEKPGKACEKTKGEYVTYQNRVVRTFFYSTSGGATEFPANVWGGKKAYLRSVADIYENKPEKKPWTIFYTKKELTKLLEAFLRKKSFRLGSVEDVKVLKVSESERVRKIKVLGSEGEIELKDNEIRTILDLPSMKFRIFKPHERADMVSVLSLKNQKTHLSKIGLRGKKILSDKGKNSLFFREDNGGQVMVLSAKNRKGFYLGKDEKGDFIFVGSGFGHGVGLSQSGARGMAEAGFDYREILRHYFKGAEVN